MTALTVNLQSGYLPRFMPICNPCCQPVALHQKEAYNKQPFNAEPIFLTLSAWQAGKKRSRNIYDGGGEYLTTWYVGEIDEGVVRLIISSLLVAGGLTLS
jgi:hypothetical protein